MALWLYVFPSPLEPILNEQMILKRLKLNDGHGYFVNVNTGIFSIFSSKFNKQTETIKHIMNELKKYFRN